MLAVLGGPPFKRIKSASLNQYGACIDVIVRPLRTPPTRTESVISAPLKSLPILRSPDFPYRDDSQTLSHHLTVLALNGRALARLSVGLRGRSLGEQGALISPSGDPAQGTFIPGLYGNAGERPDNRDHVEVWRFDDGGSLVYDWADNSYTIKLPSGTVNIEVGSSKAVLTNDAITAKSTAISAEAESITAKATMITLQGAVQIDGPLQVTGDIFGLGKIIDTGGNTANHKH